MQARKPAPAWLFFLVLAGFASSHALEFDRQFGEASFKFLKLPLSPRVVGLGGSGVALADGAGEMDLNPAAPAADSGALVLGKGYPFSEFQASSSHISWSIPAGGYCVLLNARYLGFDDIPGFSEQDRSTSAYGAHTLKAQAGVAGVFRKLHWGATVGYAGNSIANANYSSGVVSAGARYFLYPGLVAGVSAVNADFWDSRAKDAANRDPFPPTALQAGLAYSRALGAGFAAAAEADARTRNDERLVWPLGLELAWRNTLFARAGFPFGEQEPGFAAGLGLQWSLFRFQYAYQSHETLSPAHYWSLDIRY
ncbi:MAG TPA: hypothetical protein VJ385_08840 [Fibrobacteria bacterium]|nr:hypothetical protein [Fibrobacteria bacterium]